MFDYVKDMKPIRGLHKEWENANMHIMEPTQNSADIHHFTYLHKDVPYFFGAFATTINAAPCDYSYKGNDYVFRMDNEAANLKFMKKEISGAIAETVRDASSVICYGPTLQLTVTQY